MEGTFSQFLIQALFFALFYFVLYSLYKSRAGQALINAFPKASSATGIIFGHVGAGAVLATAATVVGKAFAIDWLQILRLFCQLFGGC